MRTRHASRSALTIIEVLVATLLASLMLSAVAGLLGALARQERILSAKQHQPAWQIQLSEELLWDLRNARRYAVTESGVFLDGFGGRDFGSLRPTGEPALIAYALVDAGGERWLVRQELHPADRTNRIPRVDLVCRGAEQLQWGEAVVKQPLSGNPVWPNADRFMNIPEHVAVQLLASGAAEPIFQEVLCVR